MKRLPVASNETGRKRGARHGPHHSGRSINFAGIRADDHEPGKLVLTRADYRVAGSALAVGAGGTAVGLIAKTNVAAVLAFIAAIFVALLTAYWTQRRLSQELAAADRRLAQQLKTENNRWGAQMKAEIDRNSERLTAENQRHVEQLDADRQRLELQLAHDRRLHDLEELRSLLDTVVTDLADAVHAFLDCARVAERESFDAAVYDIAYQALQVQRRKVQAGFTRLSIRARNEATIALHNVYKALVPPTINNALPDREQVGSLWDNAQALLAERHGEFLRLAASLVGSRLPDSEGAES